MIKRLLIFCLLFTISLFIPIGCSLTGNQTTNPPDENTLSIFNWSTYIDPEAIALFEKQFNAKVKYDTFESNDELYAKLKPGNPGYDVIFPSDYMVTLMAKENKLEALNLTNIPNFKNLEPKFINTPFDPQNQYSVPYQWGTMGLGYNLKKTRIEINSWKQIFEPQFKGEVAFTDELRSMLGGILIYLGFSPNTTNPDEINQAKNFIIQHKDSILAFAPDNGQNLLDQGDADIAVEWSGDIFQVMAENSDLRYSIPIEGSIIWIDNLSIPKNAPHKDLAEKFINFILEPEISAKISNYIKYGSPNKTAIEQGLIDEKLLKNPAIYPPAELFERLTYIKDVGEANKYYDQAWTEVKVGVSK